MMTNDDFPLCGRGSQGGLEPLELLRNILIADVLAIAGFVPVASYHRRRVQKEEVDGRGVVNLAAQGEITRGHLPAPAQLAVGNLRVAIAEIIVVAEGDVPRDLQGRGGINVFKRLLPLRIV